MKTNDQNRLAEIRSQAHFWASHVDTSTWETPFLLRLLDEKSQEIAILKRKLTLKDKAFVHPALSAANQ